MQPSIGNDIVDLKDAGNPLHPRFISRVCSVVEQQLGVDQHSIWNHWAAKEAAYKALKRVRPETLFSPMKFEFDPTGNFIKFETITMPILIVRTAQYVAAVSATDNKWLQSESFHSWVKELPDGNADLSLAVRNLAITKIARVLKIDPSRLSIEKDLNQPKIPVLSIEGTLQPHLLSFSHHGRFVMCSVLLV